VSRTKDSLVQRYPSPSPVVDISFWSATVKSFPVVWSQRRPKSQPFGQVGIGDKISAKGYNVGISLRQHGIGTFAVEVAGDVQNAMPLGS